MNCVDHPKVPAVALIGKRRIRNNKYIDYTVGACHPCFIMWKKSLDSDEAWDEKVSGL